MELVSTCLLVAPVNCLKLTKAKAAAAEKATKSASTSAATQPPQAT